MARVFLEALQNQPDSEDPSHPAAFARLWWEGTVRRSSGFHPGIASLDRQHGRTAFITLLVQACGALDASIEADLERRFVGVLRALYVVAAGRASAQQLDEPISHQLLGELSTATRRSDQGAAVARARVLWRHFSGQSGRECDSLFARFRQEGANELARWNRDHAEALVIAAERPLGGIDPQELSEMIEGLPSSTRWITALYGRLDAADLNLMDAEQAVLSSVKFVACAGIEQFAKMLFEIDESDRVALRVYERIFIERFISIPKGDVDERGGQSLWQSEASEPFFDKKSEEHLDGLRFLFTWTLIPGVGDLHAGRAIAWNTLVCFVTGSLREPREGLARRVRQALELVSYLWPKKSGDFSPDEVSEETLARLARRLGSRERAALDRVRAVLEIAGLRFKRRGSVRGSARKTRRPVGGERERSVA